MSIQFDTWETNIDNELNEIKEAKYGKDVRDAIHDGIEKGFEKANSAASYSKEVKTHYDGILLEWESDPNKDPELINARGTHPTLSDRLNTLPTQTDVASVIDDSRDLFAEKADVAAVNTNVSEISTQLEDKNLHRPIYTGTDYAPTSLLQDGDVYLQMFQEGEMTTPYREGEFVPNFASSSGDIGLTHVLREGSYVKVGNLVTVQIRLELLSKGNLNDDGEIRIDKLPFMPKVVQNVFAGEVRGYLTHDLPINGWLLTPGNNHATLRVTNTANGNVASARMQSIGDNFRVVTTFSYLTGA